MKEGTTIICVILSTIALTSLFWSFQYKAAYNRGFEFGKGIGKIDAETEAYRQLVHDKDLTQKTIKEVLADPKHFEEKK